MAVSEASDTAARLKNYVDGQWVDASTDSDAGMLGVNLGVPAPMAFFPFSGYKKSFYGDLHANGRDGVEFYTRKKMVTARY